MYWRTGVIISNLDLQTVTRRFYLAEILYLTTNVNAMKPIHLIAAAIIPLLIGATPASAGNLDLLLSGLFPEHQATYIGYESVERDVIPVTSAIERKYLIVDFRLNGDSDTEQLQASVHKVCMALLKDRELIRDLSSQGYDMVSVAFDRRSQFDCL